MNLFLLKIKAGSQKKVKPQTFDLQRDILASSKSVEILAAKLQVAILEGHLTREKADKLLNAYKEVTEEVAQNTAPADKSDVSTIHPENKLSWLDRWLENREQRNREKVATNQSVSQQISNTSGSLFEYTIRDTWLDIKSASLLYKLPAIGGIVVWAFFTFFPKSQSHAPLTEKMQTVETTGVNFYSNMTIKDENLKIEKKSVPSAKNPPVKKATNVITQKRAQNEEEVYRRNSKKFGIYDIDSINVSKKPEPPVVEEKESPEPPRKKVRPPRADYKDTTDKTYDRVQ